MGRSWTTYCGLVAGLVLPLQPAQAGDRKSDRTQRSVDVVVVSREFHSVSRDVSSSEGVTFSTGKQSTKDEEDENAAANGGHRKPFTFFNIKSKAGDIAVQPAIGGGVKGVQLSLGF